jgi:hypothetical protein
LSTLLYTITLIYYYIAFNLLAFLGSANYCAFFLDLSGQRSYRQ